MNSERNGILKKENIIGIVGGMGPEAGIVLFNRILFHTAAAADQDHLPVVLMSFPGNMMDRTAYLEGSAGTNPAYSVSGIIAKLETAGARIIGIACNTSHSPVIFDVIVSELEQMNSEVMLVHMPYETCRYIKDNHGQVRRVGLMATNGTYRSGVYENLLRDRGYEVVIPDYEFQDNIIHKMVYDPGFGMKANAGRITPEAISLMKKAVAYFKERRADAVVLGCTELSMIKDRIEPEDLILVDSTEALALALIREATKGNMKFIRKLNYL